jgi:U3 small nucleolar RNA-associated protein 20
LNFTDEYTWQVKKGCQTLAQLIYNKNSLIETTTEFIKKADPLSLQPILELTAQLARDLQQDFYEHFPQVFDAIASLLDTQNTEVLEWSFQTLSYLFKFLWRYMLKDLNNVYSLYSPLFAETRKHYIRNFAAESFSFIMRKVTEKNELYDFLFNRLKEHPEVNVKNLSREKFG